MLEVITNALSIDVEEYFQAEAFSQLVPRKKWEEYPSRIIDSTRQILKLCAKYEVKATFFVLSWVAERHPEFLREISSQGHEIGSHGTEHQLIYDQTPADFRTCIHKSKKTLEDITQQTVIGFRAPTFSITKKSLWALDILAEEGFKYDSSIFPIHHDRYGIPGAQRFPHKILGKPKLYEFPPSTICLGGINLPVGGGGYLRLLPFTYTTWGIKQLNLNGHPALVYLHPWEVDSEQPRLGLQNLAAYRHYHNLNKTMSRLERLLRKFKFAPVREVLQLK